MNNQPPKVQEQVQVSQIITHNNKIGKIIYRIDVLLGSIGGPKTSVVFEERLLPKQREIHETSISRRASEIH